MKIHYLLIISVLMVSSLHADQDMTKWKTVGLQQANSMGGGGANLDDLDLKRLK